MKNPNQLPPEPRCPKCDAALILTSDDTDEYTDEWYRCSNPDCTAFYEREEIEMTNKPLPPQEIREVVARFLWAHDIAPHSKEKYLNDADQLLSKLSKPPYNVVRLAEDQNFPSQVYLNEEIAPTEACKGYREAEHNIKKAGFKKVRPLVDGTVKEG